MKISFATEILYCIVRYKILWQFSFYCMKVCIQHFCLPNKNVSHLLFLLSFSTSPNLVMSYRRTDVITQWHVLKQSKLMVNKCSVLFVKAYVSPLCKPSINRSVSSYWKMFSIITEICLMHYKDNIWTQTVPIFLNNWAWDTSQSPTITNFQRFQYNNNGYNYWLLSFLLKKLLLFLH